jgi:hypothetical protein
MTFPRHAAVFPCLLALTLLVTTLQWHIPMMLWDHLDLVPMQAAFRDGRLGHEFWQLHGGHWHSAAYAVLLLSTSVSAGTAWVDAVLSWLLLIGFAAIVARLINDSRQDGRRSGSPWWLLVMGLALYPGHLANLQWGWQVAVFLALVGIALCVVQLTRSNLSWPCNIGALAAALLALASFATAIALIPTALALIALRTDISRMRRLALAAPWLLLGLAMALHYRTLALHDSSVQAGIGMLLLYALNFLGAGISRFASSLAPAFAAIALITTVWLLPSIRRDRLCLPWLCLLLFAGFAAGAVALGRAGSFGADHAFASRYVSFSSLFWLGWVGLLLTAERTRQSQVARRWLRIGLGVVLLFASLNALQMMNRAAKLAGSTRDTAAEIRATYPDVDETLLRAIYFEQPDVALQRLRMLNTWGYPPFEVGTDEPVQ